MITYSLQHSLQKGLRKYGQRASDLGITGIPYPGETLTSTVSGQWYVNDVESGSPSTTYTVDVSDIGKPVRCGDSEPVTIWHPTDVTTNMILLTPNVGALHSIEPDVEATDGQTVRRILDQSGNGWHADQATGANQPTRQVSEVGGNDTLLFDGANDFMSFSGGALSLFRNRGYGYIIASCRDTNRAAGAVSHSILLAGNNAGATRLSLFTRLSSSDTFAAAGRRLDSDSFVSAGASSNINYNTITNKGMWQTGAVALSTNGSQVASVALSTSGNTSDTDSSAITIGADTSSGQTFPGHISCLMVLSPDTALSDVNLRRLERYAYLCGPGPTEVTLDPSDSWA